MVGAVVGQRLATLHELETVYSLRDALDLMEIITVQHYNEWVASQEASHGNGR